MVYSWSQPAAALEAEDQLREAARVDPKSADFHSDLGDLPVERHHENEAIAEYREALRLNANLDGANLGLGSVLVRQGNSSAGKAYCEVACTVRINRSSIWQGRASFANR